LSKARDLASLRSEAPEITSKLRSRSMSNEAAPATREALLLPHSSRRAPSPVEGGEGVLGGLFEAYSGARALTSAFGLADHCTTTLPTIFGWTEQ
jgi:hypothetical protein